MKKILILFLLFMVGTTTYSQEKFTFKIAGVDSPQKAKIVIEMLRNDFLYETSFSYATNTFEIPSTQYVEESDLIAKLLGLGYTLIDFDKTITVTYQKL